MIRHTFSMLNGIGEKLERHIWRRGILTWGDFCNCDGIEGVSSERKAMYDSELSSALEELDAGNAEYFAKTMKRREHWRLFDAFRDGAICLDIETNGYQPNQGGYVTVVGLYDGYDYQCFIRGENLTAEALSKAFTGYKCLITFYGACFDVPFLLKSFPGLKFDIPHFDLCFAARRLKIEGGMKKLETVFGIERDDSVKGMDGYAAVKLWEQAVMGSAEAMNTLIAYNREDTENLLAMADILYHKLKDSTGFEGYKKQ